MSILKRIVGSRNDRILKDYRKILNKVNSFSNEVKIIKDIDFHHHTNELKKKYKEGEALEEILPYAYA